MVHKENWANGDPLTDVSGVSGVPEPETVSWGSNGHFAELAWPTELDAGEYQLILDLNCTGYNGEWTNITDPYGGYITDPIWPFTVTGPTQPIPEFSTIAIPVVSILGLLFLFNYRKRRREG